MLRTKKLITIIFSILMCLSLFGCKQDTKQEEINEPITQETQQEIEAIDTKEEPKQEETEVIEEVPILEPKKEEITAKSYVLHVGIAEDITLTVNRIYSKVGAPLVKINPETTKIYEGDKLSVSISTKGNMEPVFQVDEATQNEDLTYTVNTSDVTITTGYKTVKQVQTSQSPKLYIVVKLNISSSSYPTTAVKKSGSSVYEDKISFPNYTTEFKTTEVEVGDLIRVKNDAAQFSIKIYKYDKKYGKTPTNETIEYEETNINSKEDFVIGDYCYYIEICNTMS